MKQGKREERRADVIKAWLQSHKRQLLIGAVAVAAIGLIIAAIAVSMWITLPEVPVRENTTTTTTESDGTETDTLPSVSTGNNLGASDRREGVYTFLVAGRDTLGGGLTDTMILITYDAVNATIDAMSLPRDTMVNISASSKKLNSVYNYYKGSDPDTQVEKGITALKEEVEGLTGIYPDFYVMVSWDAVGELVDAIGGVWFEVPYYMDYDDPEQDLHIHQAAGYRLLDGDDAMQVIRHRQNNDGSHSYGDVGRIAVQQDFLMAMAEQCLTPAILLKASSLIEFFLTQVTTDLTFGNLLAFAQSAYGIDVTEDVNICTMPYELYYRYSSYVLPVAEELLPILNGGLNPYTTEITIDDLELLYQIDSAGRMGVTSGELADSTLANPPVYTSTTTVEEEEEPEVDEEEFVDGAESEEEVTTDSDLFAQPDPELPDPEPLEESTTESQEAPTSEETTLSTDTSKTMSDLLALLNP